jgi:hypothetical protein
VASTAAKYIDSTHLIVVHNPRKQENKTFQALAITDITPPRLFTLHKKCYRYCRTGRDRPFSDRGIYPAKRVILYYMDRFSSIFIENRRMTPGANL